MVEKNKSPIYPSLNEWGKVGEQDARTFLEKKGYLFVAARVRTPFGEIDLVMKEGRYWVFVEVKRRRNEEKGQGQESVGYHKQRHIIKSALAFMSQRNIDEDFTRFDVISLGPQGLEHIEDAFGSGGEFYI